MSDQDMKKRDTSTDDISIINLNDLTNLSALDKTF